MMASQLEATVIKAAIEVCAEFYKIAPHEFYWSVTHNQEPVSSQFARLVRESGTLIERVMRK
jgi:hypothetical protein